MPADTRCIFCRKDASSSCSTEHVIPESLGNDEHVLPVGVVCDGCNSYFAVKIEKPLLESGYFTALRSHQAVPNKRGDIPLVLGMHVQTRTRVGACKIVPGQREWAIEVEDMRAFISATKKTGGGTLIFPIASAPPMELVERFLAKVGLEILAQRLRTEPEWRSEVLRPEFDAVRRFARFNEGPRWPVHVRRIYAEELAFPSEEGDPYQVLHEYDLLYSDRAELYVVVAIFGMELTINLGCRSVDGYLDWLRRHNGTSPLYTQEGRYPV